MEKVLENVINVVRLLYEVIKAVILSCVPDSLRTKKNVRGEICLISGSGSGLGRLVAIKLARLGCGLALVDVDTQGNRETLRLIMKENSDAKAKAYECDVSDRDSVYRLAKTVSEEMGDVSILINNAGIGAGGPLLAVEDEKISKTLAVNLMAQFYTVKAFLPAMLMSNHGHLVHLSSCAGLVGIPKMTSYSASKFAIYGFAEALQLELLEDGYDGVKSTTVCLFPVNTGLLKYNDNGLLQMLDAEYVAGQIVKGILLDKEVVCLPGYIIYSLLFLRPFLSRRAILSGVKLLVGDGLINGATFRKFGN